MPKIPINGVALSPGSVGEYQVPSRPITKAAPAPIQFDRFARNARYPDAHFMNQLTTHANAGAIWRSKLVHAGMNKTNSAISSTASSRTRVRAAWHSGPYAHALQVAVAMLPPDSGLDQDTYAKVRVYSDATETTLVATEEFHYGPSPTGSTIAYGWPYMQTMIRTIDGIAPDTDYYLRVSDENYGRVQSALAFELASLTENFSGYLPTSITPLTPIGDSFREKLASLTRSLWSKGASSLFTFNVDDHGTPIVNTTGTATNVVDTTVTTISAASPGYILNMTGKDRISQTSGVPVVLKAFGSVASLTGGNVYLKDSTGVTVGSITNGWSSATPSWVSTTFNIPTTSASAKYDLQFAKTGGGGNFSLYAVSVYEKD